MLIAAAIFLVAVAALHSFLGGARLINPICRRADLPIILGSRRRTILTLQLGWHCLSLFWVALALLLLSLHADVEGFSQVFLLGWASVFAVSFLISVVAGRGRHLSWVFFLAIAACLFAASGGTR